MALRFAPPLRRLGAPALLSLALLAALHAPAEPGADALGDPLPAGAVRRFGSDRLTHLGTVECAAFSPDGRRLASGGHDNTVRVWDAATGKQLQQFPCARWVRAVVWSPDGAALIYASDGDGIRVRDVASGKVLRQLPERGWVVHLALTPDGKTLAAGEADGTGRPGGHGTVRLWDLASGRELHQFPVTRAYGVTFSPAGRLLAVTGDTNVRVWEVATGQERDPLTGHKHGTNAVAFSPDGKLLAAGSRASGTEVICWDVRTGREVERRDRLGGMPTALLFSPRGGTLAIGVHGPLSYPILCQNRIDDPGSAALVGHASPVHALSFTPDSRRLASAGCWERTVRVWDVGARESALPYARHYGELTGVAFAPDGRTLATASHDHTVLLWRVDTGAKLAELRGHRHHVHAVAYSPDGRLIASGGGDRTVRLWDAASGQERRCIEASRLRITSVAFSPDGRILASGEGLDENSGPTGVRMPDGAVRLWDVGTGKQVHELLAQAGRVDTIAYSPDGGILASAGPDDRAVHLWDPATGRALRKLQGPPDPATPRTMSEGVLRLTFSPDGRTLAAVSGYRYPSNIRQLDPEEREVRMVRLWEVATGAERCELRARYAGPDGRRGKSPHAIGGVAFSADGQTLILGKADGAVRLWHLPTEREARLLPGHQDRVTAVALAPDGRTFATASWDTTALLWDAAPLARPRPDPVALSGPAREALWADLASPDGARAYRALWSVVAAAPDVLPVLAERLRPVPDVPAGRVARLLRDLEDEQFSVREAAQRELEAYADAVVAELRQAARSADVSLEARRRLDRLLARHAGVVPAPEAVRALRAVEALEYTGSTEARRLLQVLAGGAPAARLTREAKASLERLSRHAAVP